MDMERRLTAIGDLCFGLNARYDPEVGYTQGLAFIVAALLLNMPDEEAFCVLVRLMESVCIEPIAPPLFLSRNFLC